MAGYSKLRFLNKKSRSIDFSDLLITNTFPDDQTKGAHDQDASPTGLDHRRTSAAREEINTIHEHDSDQDQVADGRNACTRKSTDTGVGGIHLSKNSSVSSETSSHYWFNLRSWQRSATTTTTTSSTPKSGLQSAVKRAFTMRRSSSVLSHHEKYRRIHDQCVAILLETSPFDDEYEYDDNDDDATVETKEDKIPTTMGSMEEKKCGSRGKILKTCKRLLRFYQ